MPVPWNLNWILNSDTKRLWKENSCFCILNKFHGCGSLSKSKVTQATFLKSLLNKGSEFEEKGGNNTIIIQTGNVLNCFRIAPINWVQSRDQLVEERTLQAQRLWERSLALLHTYNWQTRSLLSIWRDHFVRETQDCTSIHLWLLSPQGHPLQKLPNWKVTKLAFSSEPWTSDCWSSLFLLFSKWKRF